jgi:PAT family beta-lactamase induction signal transducer AmpG
LAWVASAYFAEGIPFALVIWVSGTLLKDLGRGDAEITLATASIAVVWSLKPLWAWALDVWRSKKFFVLAMEAAMAALLLMAAWVVRQPFYFGGLVVLLWALAFCSATQDICIDGVYITSLDETRQAQLIGYQGTAWNVGRIFATAVLVWLAGTLKTDFGVPAASAWSWSLTAAAAAMALLALYHRAVLPHGAPSVRAHSLRSAGAVFVDSLRTFFVKPRLWGMLAFVFLYRSGEGFLLVEAPLFIQAPQAAGGLGLSLQQKGAIDGTISTLAVIVFGILGGAFIAKRGLRRSLFWMAIAINVPHVCYVVLSQLAASHHVSLFTVGLLVTLEKVGYGFGFVANMLYMMQQIAPGKYPMTHYAFCTALMNLVLVPTQMASGPLAELLGYKTFFLFVMLASIPSLIAAWFAPFPHQDRAA